jgi:hypothetical protein
MKSSNRATDWPISEIKTEKRKGTEKSFRDFYFGKRDLNHGDMPIEYFLLTEFEKLQNAINDTKRTINIVRFLLHPDRKNITREGIASSEDAFTKNLLNAVSHMVPEESSGVAKSFISMLRKVFMTKPVNNDDEIEVTCKCLFQKMTDIGTEYEEFKEKKDNNEAEDKRVDYFVLGLQLGVRQQAKLIGFHTGAILRDIIGINQIFFAEKYRAKNKLIDAFLKEEENWLKQVEKRERTAG